MTLSLNGRAFPEGGIRAHPHYAITVSMFIKRLGLTCAGSTLSTSLDYLSYDANPYGVKCSEPSISESASIIWFIRVSSLLFT